MKRAAVIAVQVAAAVLVGLAIRELWLAVTGEGDSTAAPRSAVAVTADVTPNVVAFGTPVVATADVVADARIVRPESIALQVDFTPYELAGSAEGRAARDRLERARPVPLPAPVPARRMRAGGRARRCRVPVRPRPLPLPRQPGQRPGHRRVALGRRRVARRGAPTSRRSAGAPARRSCPRSRRRVGPKGLAVVLLLGALALVAGAVLARPPPLARPRRCRTRWNEGPSDHRSSARSSLRAPSSATESGRPDRRRALERVGRELDVLGFDALGEDARALAWSPQPRARRRSSVRAPRGGRRVAGGCTHERALAPPPRRRPADLGGGRAARASSGARAGFASCLAAAALALLLGAFGLSRELHALPTSYFATGSGGIVVLDLSTSVDAQKSQRVQRVLQSMAETEGRVGLIVFSDSAYEMLPPDTRSEELRPLLRFFDQGPVGLPQALRRPAGRECRTSPATARGEPVVAHVPGRYAHLDRARRGARGYRP